MIKTDNQPISSRFGDAVWLTDFITPHNPSVMVKYQKLTEGVINQDERMKALWEYVARMRYKSVISSQLRAGSKVITQPDTWFFPAEVMQLGESNCANRSFLLASLLKNEITNVYCVMGYLTLDGIGAHAWVEIDKEGQRYLVESTQPNLEKAFIPVSTVKAYQPQVYFDEQSVFIADSSISVAAIMDARFGVCAVPFLRDYLCEECLALEV